MLSYVSIRAKAGDDVTAKDGLDPQNSFGLHINAACELCNNLKLRAQTRLVPVAAYTSTIVIQFLKSANLFNPRAYAKIQNQARRLETDTDGARTRPSHETLDLEKITPLVETQGM